MELYSEFRPLFIFSNICGLGSFGPYRNGKIQQNRKLFLWSLTVLWILCGLQLLVLLDCSGTTRLANSMVADMIDTYGFMITCLGGFIIHFALSNDLLLLWNRVLKIHPKIKGPGTEIKRSIFGAFVYEIAFGVLSIWIEPSDYDSFFYYVIETLTYVALEVSNYVIFLQFNHLVLACWRSFKHLNSKLYKLLVSVHFQTDYNRTRSRLMLKKLSLQHGEIVSVCGMINKLFAVQNLLSVTLIFIELTYSFYSGMVHWKDDFSAAIVTDTILWAGYFIYKLVVMLTVCSVTTMASCNTEKLLQKFTYDEDDVAFAIEVEYFTLQLLHDNSLFDAYGFYKLDFTLIYSMISSVSGYLVCLVQFSHLRVGNDIGDYSRNKTNYTDSA